MEDLKTTITEITEEEAKRLFDRLRKGELVRYEPSGKVIDITPNSDSKAQIVDVTEEGHNFIVKQVPKTGGHFHN
ncbi:hypothetical protein FJZ31_04490 [Candidatus Poribacteria bacterium]|nr:hypothetical protein [Candidatus Poribacteria bacterium]